MKKLFIAFAAVMMVAAFATTSVAGDWGFYGSARVSWWSIDSDRGTNRSERNSRFQLQNNSRLGARVKGGKVYGRFEFGINPDNDAQNPFGTGANVQGNGAGPAVYTRLLFGAWNFGSGTMVVGQDYTPCYLSVSSANLGRGSDSVMIGFGVPYPGRRAQWRLEIAGLQFAIVDNTAASNLGATDSTGAAANTKISIPRVEARYTFKFDPVSFDIAGAYQTYDIQRQAWENLSVDSYFVGLRGSAKLGPIVLKGVVWGGQNVNEEAISGQVADGAMLANNGLSSGRVVDNDAIGFCITGNYKLNDMVQFEAGYGYVKAEQDDASVNNRVGGVATGAVVAGTSGAMTDDKVAAYYLHSIIELAKGVFLQPEIGYIDYKNSNLGVDQGDDQYFGAKFQIDF